jgi:hypothetical protein
MEPAAITGNLSAEDQNLVTAAQARDIVVQLNMNVQSCKDGRFTYEHSHYSCMLILNQPRKFRYLQLDPSIIIIIFFWYVNDLSEKTFNH